MVFGEVRLERTEYARISGEYSEDLTRRSVGLLLSEVPQLLPQTAESSNQAAEVKTVDRPRGDVSSE
jgi:hypothetical protein